MGSMVITSPASEPIAIIGLSCKFAGSARNPEALWQLLAEKRSAWSEIPSARFNAKGVYHPNPEKLSTVSFEMKENVEAHLLMRAVDKCSRRPFHRAGCGII